MMYPEPPPHGAFPASMDMNVSPDTYYPRPGHSHQHPHGEYPTATTTGFDANVLYASDASYGMYNKGLPAGMASPPLFPEDGEMRLPSSNLSIASYGSAPSSVGGSPRSAHGLPQPGQGWQVVSPEIAGQNEYFPAAGTEFPYAPTGGPGMEDFAPFEYGQDAKDRGFVDPILIHPGMDRPMGIPAAAYESTFPPPPANYPASPALTGSPQIRTGSTSPFMPNHSSYPPYGPFPTPVEARRHSVHSGYSAEQPYSGDESTKEKQRCPHPDCGKSFKDLKAHMLTHQTERPEKCPIQTCEYHVKGFARKYDKNRHTLTHYKGTMVCGFCPGSGSAAEKSFNRADVFKRHLTAVHGVEQSPPNGRKKATSGNPGVVSKKITGYAPDATGKCSTCSATFSNAQDFYEHLDDCVLRIVQQEDPAEAINAKRLAEVEDDKEVLATLEKHNLPATTSMTCSTEDYDEEEVEEDDDIEMDGDSKAGRGSKVSSSPTKKKGSNNPVNGVQKSRGMTHSRGGVPLIGKPRGRKNRGNYPSSWGFDKGQMTMKKRVASFFDGPRRLAKDDMMLSTEHEVRVKLQDGKSYVTDLDVQTLRRADGFHSATEEEKGIWLSDDPTEEQMAQMAAAAARGQ